MRRQSPSAAAVGSLLGRDGTPRPAIHDRTSEASQPILRGPSLRWRGKWPSLTYLYNVERLIPVLAAIVRTFQISSAAGFEGEVGIRPRDLSEILSMCAIQG